ncbi:MAG: SGNH/GDSL hydrolase family protein [Clostridia bacterium]|nr:SGNH/GDSL hydrolase family protein [Clostridia bacterium]
MLENLAARLVPGAELTIGYFGGSITEGAGASEEEKNWQCITFAWLRSRYPQVTFHRIQAAIGGTGSTLGVCRCETDLTRHKPDLVFFEFAVNDNGGNFMELCNNAESILLKIWRANPLAEVVMIYTTTKSMEEKLVAGEVLSSRTAQSAVAYYYDLLQIDVGEALRRAVAKEGFDWLTFTKEGVHPLDNGYRIYADLIIEKLKDALERAGGAVAAPRTLPKPLFTPEGGSRVEASPC